MPRAPTRSPRPQPPCSRRVDRDELRSPGDLRSPGTPHNRGSTSRTANQRRRRRPPQARTLAQTGSQATAIWRTRLSHSGQNDHAGADGARYRNRRAPCVSHPRGALPLRPAKASVSQVSDDALGRRPTRQRAGAWSETPAFRCESGSGAGARRAFARALSHLTRSPRYRVDPATGLPRLLALRRGAPSGGALRAR
jgi:hypothetical protein